MATISDHLDNLNYSGFSRSLAKRFLPNGKMPDSVRSLTKKEIARLEKQGNISGDWTAIKVSADFIPDYINHSQFLGSCTLGRFDGELVELVEGGCLPRGIRASTLHNADIASGCVIEQCAMLSSIQVAERAVISHSQLVATSSCATFGNGQWINVGIETGGRSVPLFADLSLDLAEFILSNPANTEVRAKIDTFLVHYCAEIGRSRCFVGTGACIQGCRLISDSYIGPYARLFHADSVENSTIDSNKEDPVFVGIASIIRDAIIQEGCSVKDGAIIQSSMLFEHSHASQHGTVIDCLVGPNSGVSKGEATASFLGPFVGFHHQSLLIAAVWPRGRGNVAYGANVGSNHTSRVPDQEFWPGEGMFFGLACSIKYPANFREAPYTIVAAGVTTLPQRMSFPFSLVNEPVAYYLEVAPGLQNLIPAWGLSENFYALMRNEGKYKERNKAKRNRFDLDLFRPEILAYMKQAKDRLVNIPVKKNIYLPGDIEGIGKNMMTEDNRQKAIVAYDFFLELAELRSIRDGARTTANPATPHEKYSNIPDALSRLKEMLPSLISRTESSRARDFERGCLIIDDYAQTHVGVDDDAFVLQVREEIAAEIAEITEIQAQWRV